ncbi:MAG TPA: hypothetical protein VK326_00115 [Solirubrobacterales bacterium]|nr:hypothetical protein [Solirubrobacterales bacterium]
MPLRAAEDFLVRLRDRRRVYVAGERVAEGDVPLFEQPSALPLAQ